MAATSLAPLLLIAWFAVERDELAGLPPPVRVSSPSTPLGSGASAPTTTPPESSPAPATTATLNATDELDEVTELRRLGLTNPERSLELTQRSRERASPEAAPAEVMWFEARALVELGRFDEARVVAQAMLERHPSEPWTLDARRHLLSHPFGLPAREH